MGLGSKNRSRFLVGHQGGSYMGSGCPIFVAGPWNIQGAFLRASEANAKRIVSLLRRLEEIFEVEGGSHWLPGIQATRAAGEEALASGQAQQAMSLMSSIYRGMQQGPGGFDDFFVWRDSLAERVEANRELSELRDELWGALGA